MKFLGAALAVIALWAQAQSQNTAGSAALKGTVRDGRGRAVAVTVHLQSKNGGETLAAQTDPEGRYHFSGLPEGAYTLRAEMSGMGEATFGPFTLARREVKQVDLTLRPAFFDEPTFIVAGVTDASSRGGHGSDTVLRSTEALARAAASLGKQPSAAQNQNSLREAIARDPANAGLHHQLGEVEEKQGNALEAVREYQRAAELDATEPNLFDWGAELLAHRAAEQAIEIFTRGSRLFPHSTRMLLGLATAYYSRGAYEQASQRFFEACDWNPADPTPYLFLGKVQVAEINGLPGFVERLGRFAGLQPGNALANYYYAAALWKQWKGPEDSETPAQARALLEKAVKLDPNLSAAYLQLGIVYADLKEFSNAIAALEKAIAVNPELAEAHYRLAQAYRKTGDDAKARQEFALHDRLSKQSAKEAQRERSEIQEFVFALRNR
jgi:tetratricopeptide (TPR) repeat protein